MSPYLDPKRDFTHHPAAPVRAVVVLLLSVLMLSFAGVAAAVSTPRHTAAADDPIQWLACKFGDKSLPNLIYQVTQTSDLQFELFSKSYSGNGKDDVTGGLNAVLDYVMTKGKKNSPYSFKAVNERIIGQTLSGSLPVTDDSYKRWNNGPKVNPYNRFGVAGLKFSSYMGEWKHLFIDACATDAPSTAHYDTGASTNSIRIASWNVCSYGGVCNRPEFPNPQTGAPFTPEEIWPPFPERAKQMHDREFTIMHPDVYLGQEVKDKGDASEALFNQVVCEGSGLKPLAKYPGETHICYNPDKFTAIDNKDFAGAQGGKRLPYGSGSFTWAVLEDQSYRRSVFVSVHIQAHAGYDAVRGKQTRYILHAINTRFAGSFYPIIIGGDWNSHDPLDCDHVQGTKDSGPEVAAVNLCAAGYKSTNMLAEVPIDLQKASFQGYTPWRSHDGAHLDHIWVNGYVGVGESRVFAPAGPAPSDHAMVSATVNLNGINAVQTGDPQDPQTNLYYDTRREPRSTWEDISTTQDVRTVQFSKGFTGRFISSVMVNVENGIFFFTKLIVVLTIAFIGLSFTNAGDLLGITQLVGGGEGKEGLFTSLHNNVFMPLVVLSIMGTAIYLFWMGIVKRQVRTALGATLRSIILFLIACIIAVSPAWFIALPNNVAIVGEALVASQLDNGLVGGNGLCASNVDSADTILSGTTGLDATDPTQAQSILDRAAVNAQSSAGCVLWYNLLVRPWVKGQFGDEYTELYGTVGGVCHSNRDPDNPVSGDPMGSGPSGEHVCLGFDKPEGKNRNYLWVGDPIVPLGGGNCATSNFRQCNAKIESNWALLQISTQTNAHAPILPPEDRGVGSKYSQGVANDWWRIVDAVSNYDETTKTDKICNGDLQCNAIPQDTTTAPYPHPLPTDTMREWDNWVGNNNGQRLAVVFFSVFIAFLAVLAPLFFALLSVVYSVGIALLMAFAPIFFLLGCWADRGWDIFKAWGDLVVNTTIKRIGLGILTVLSIAFVATILSLMDRIGYFQGVILMAIISWVLVKSRHKILNAIAFARFSTRDLSGTAGRMAGSFKTVGKAGSDMAVASAVGGVTSARRGQGFKGGALAGFKGQVENLSYRSRTLRNVLDTKNLIGNDLDYLVAGNGRNGLSCPLCGMPFMPGDLVSRVNGPTIYGEVHTNCIYDQAAFNDVVELGYIGEESNRPDTVYDSDEIRKWVRDVGDAETSAQNAILGVTNLAYTINDEIERYQLQKKARDKSHRKVTIPPVPAEIAPFVDTAAITLAWQNQEYEYLRLAYTAGWTAWAAAQSEGMELSLNDGQRLEILSVVQQTDNRVQD